MRKILYAMSLAVVIATAAAMLSAQGPPQTHRGWIHIPDSSIERSEHIGLVAHTNHQIHVDPQATGTQPTGQTPTSIWKIYVDASGSPSGGSGMIAIVDAYHYATALKDFNTFSNKFVLPIETSTNAISGNNTVFQVVYATGKQPKADCGWAQEAALDIEWAHAMAPGAKIVLVEAASSSFADLLKAVDVATSLVTAAGGGEVSMSWGGSEFSGEKTYDSHFKLLQHVVYFASSGDTGGVTIYPSVSPYVVAAGGTTLVFGGTTVTEKGWSGSGGGPSKYEAEPTYQTNYTHMPVGLKTRGVPDISFDADPNTGVSVYDSTSCQGMSGWMVFGGTSVSSPCLAGLTNASGGFERDSAYQLGSIYAGSPSYFYDVLTGTAGKYQAGQFWDYVTGIGTPRTLSGL